MLILRTRINGVIRDLDLFADEDISMEISFAEVQDITKKNSDFTKSFKLPGSKNNNDIFNHYYDFASSTFDYDSRRKFDCEILLDGSILYEGYLRLNNATRIKDEILYDVSFYSQVGNLVANIGDQLLSDLDLTDLNHNWNTLVSSTYTSDDVRRPASFSASTNPLDNGDVYYALLNKGFEYSGLTLDSSSIDYLQSPILNWSFDGFDGSGLPIVEAGYFNYSQTGIPFSYFTPSVRIKKLYETIFNEAGYNINSDFFDTDYFKKYYLPLTFADEGLYPSQAVAPRYTFELSGNPITDVPYTWTEISPPGTQSSIRITHAPVTVDTFSADTGFNCFNISQKGQYKGRVTFTARNSELFPDTVNLNAQGLFYLRLEDISSPQSPSTFDEGETQLIGGVYTIAPGGRFTDISFEFFFNINYDNTLGAIDYRSTGVGDFLIEEFKFEIIYGPRQIPSGVLDVAAELPCCQYKQLEFIQSINQFFNLLVLPVPNDPNTLRIEPVIDWIGKGDTLDWTSKVNRDEPITIQPLTTLVEGTLRYEYDEDEGFANTEFKKSNAETFGNRRIELSQDYKDKDTNFETIFGSQVDKLMTGLPQQYYATIPYYFTRKDKEEDGELGLEFNPYRTLPKLLFKNTAIPTRTIGFSSDGTYSYDFYYWLQNIGTPQYNFRNQNRFNTYPFAINNFSHYTIWNNSRFEEDEINYDGAETIYDVYWSDYIEDITDEENRLVKCKMFFDPFELKELNHKEKIIIDGTYFRINKISNYSLVERGIADVELIKLTKDYRPHRKLYYKGTSCSDSSVYYSNSDIQWGFFVFDGKTYYDKDLDDCITFEIIDDPGNVNFIRFRVDTDGAGRYKIADSCSECNSSTWNWDLDVRDDINNPVVSPTPSPTPSETPGLSPTPTTTPTPSPSSFNCYEYIIENLYNYSVNYYITDCCSGLGEGRTLPPFSSVVECSRTEPFSEEFIDVKGPFGSCGTPCPSITPSPTPTQTPTPSPSSLEEGPFEYDVYNISNESILVVEYDDCVSASPVEIELQPNSVTRICGCSAPTLVSPEGAESSLVYVQGEGCTVVCETLTISGQIDPATLVEMTDYSGGTLTGVYYNGTDDTASDFSDYDNYVRNATLGGVNYKAFQGRNNTDNGDVFLFYSNFNNGWRYIISSDSYPNFNPIYRDNGESSLTISYPNELNDTYITGGTGTDAYPPFSIYNASITGSLETNISYSVPCIAPAPSPTPSRLPGTTPTPTSTPSNTPNLSSTPTPTPSTTPTLTPSVSISPTPTPTPSVDTCNCRYYTVYNTGDTLMEYEYTDCNTSELMIRGLEPFGNESICMCDGSFRLLTGTGNAVRGGIC